jgi:hypothetical protein
VGSYPSALQRKESIAVAHRQPNIPGYCNDGARQQHRQRADSEVVTVDGQSGGQLASFGSEEHRPEIAGLAHSRTDEAMTAVRLLSPYFAALAVVTPLAARSDVLGDQTLSTYRYRVMVEVDTPEGVRRGASVIQVETHRGPGWTPDKYSASWRVGGDAVTVDLGRRGKLFMTFRDGVSSYAWPQEAMLSYIGGLSGSGVTAENKRRTEVQQVLEIKGWNCIRGCTGENQYAAQTNGGKPLFLTFRNCNNPASIRLLHYDQFDRVFGQRVKLRDIKVMVTNDPVTRTILSDLPWLVNDQAIGRLPAQPPGAWSVMFTALNKADFTRED